MNARLLGYLLLVGWGCIAARAQAPRLSFDHLTVESGLPVNIILHIGQDSSGFMWFGTKSGLSRYDGFAFTTFRHDPHDPRSLNDDNVQVIQVDASGQLWVGTYAGLNRYDPHCACFDRIGFLPANDKLSVSCLAADSRGCLWIGTPQGLFRLMPGDSLAHEVVIGGEVPDVLDLMIDRQGYLWIGTRSGIYRHRPHEGGGPQRLDVVEGMVDCVRQDPQGRLWALGDAAVTVFDAEGQRLQRHPLVAGRRSTFSTPSDLLIDRQGRCWIGTYAGMLRFDGETFTAFCEDANNPRSLNDNAIFDVFEDRKGDIWIGTYFGGVNVFHQEKHDFVHYLPHGGPRALHGKAVRALAESPDGQIWVGTEDGGLNRFDPATETFDFFPHTGNSALFGSDNIQALLADGPDRLWVGTYGGGLYLRASRQMQSFHHRPGDSLSLQSNYVLALLRDSRGTLWAGTDKGGLSRLDPGATAFQNYHPLNSPLSSDVVIALYEDRAGSIWIGHFNAGIDRYDPCTGRFDTYQASPGSPGSLPTGQITCFYEDRQGRFWIGTRGAGLLAWNDGRFTAYDQAAGLPDNTVYALLEDEAGQLWISTNRGLCCFVPGQGMVAAYTQANGLQSDQFNLQAALRSRTGELYVGGINGFNRFRPEHLRAPAYVAPLHITSLFLFNEPVAFDDSTQRLLDRPVYLTREITLRHDQNVFGFEYVLLDYAMPQENQYAFMLEGFEKKWNYVGTRRSATFTNLDPGTYVFRVIGANKAGVWNHTGSAIRIRVLPPPWRTWWAYLLYTCLGVGVLLALRHYALSQLRLQHELKIERLRREKTKELEHAKEQFFTNVSHELRTPLTLILGPLERLADAGVPRELRQSLALMRRNARRLQRMIDQLMDFSKLENGEMRASLVHSDLLALLRTTARAFEDYARQQGIAYTHQLPAGSLLARFDPDKIDQVLYNLLSNAFKYTDAGGRVSLTVEFAQGNDAETALIHVSDTGIGIAADQQALIFNRFYQAPPSDGRRRQGTGIGLELSQAFMRLHQGEILLRSEPGQGSTFTMRLPLPDATWDTGPGPVVAVEAATVVPELALAPVGDTALPLALVVEDNAEMRAFMAECLRGTYRIAEAASGEAGLVMARRTDPAVIISDVMMPGMDGIAFCTQVKEDLRISHIPVILLTARRGLAFRLRGLSTGADDYLTKPFHPRLLLARADNLVRSRQLLREKFRQGVVLPVEAPSTADGAFLEKMRTLTEAHLADPDFKIAALAREMGMSHSALYRKLKALTGLSAKEYLIRLRLQQAAVLLRDRSRNVSEVAFEVGFSDPKYFSTAFKKHFGNTPSAYSTGV
ncbi:MAG: hybrid sensor histidine kinase/response regulator transcription factor [Bacteroidia bacterium]